MTGCVAATAADRPRKIAPLLSKLSLDTVEYEVETKIYVRAYQNRKKYIESTNRAAGTTSFGISHTRTIFQDRPMYVICMSRSVSAR